MAAWNNMVMKNFDVPNSASGVIKVKCKHCSTAIAGTTTSVGNFLKHLKRKHLELYVQLVKLKDDSHKESHSKTHESPSKSPYSREFKLQVLEYFFKNGGPDNYGLKAKTAKLFSIDKKTMAKMLENQEMVQKACKAAKQKPPIKSENCVSVTNMNPNLRSASQQEMSVVDLPEDPDFSNLKSTIASSVNGVGNNAKLLLTGTKEVQNILLNECDIIYECKVCRNLFRSVVNLLAHKRIYCQEEYINTRTIYEQSSSISVESSTVVIEPELEAKKPKIDAIANKLANKNDPKELSSSVNKGSSSYFESIENAHRNRSQINKDCSIKLSSISGVKSAVFQDYIPPDGAKPIETTKELNLQVSQNKVGLTAILNEEGEVIDTVTGMPSDINTSNIKQEPENMDVSPEGSSYEGNESDDLANKPRTIYTCPICSIQFLSMGGVSKHLTKVHKKKKHQRQRLRQVISDRTFKKYLTKEEIKNYHSKEHKAVEEEPKKQQSKQTPEPKKVENSPKEEGNVRKVCTRCKRTFLTGGGLGSHMKYCHYSTFNPNVSNESSEKKISIQIRKDYKKDGIKNAQTVNGGNNKANAKERVEQEKIIKFIDERNKSMSNDNPLHCVPCEKTFVQRSNLLYHFSKHSEHTKYKCTECAFRCYHKHVMGRHCHSLHNDDSRYVLNHKMGSFKYYLQQPGDEKDKPKPEIIQKEMKVKKEDKKENNEKNMSTDLESMYSKFCDAAKTTCLPCNRKFDKKTMLMYHIARHLEHTRYKCTVCDYRCYHRYTIAEHCSVVHKDDSSFILEDKIGSVKQELASKTEVNKSLNAAVTITRCNSAESKAVPSKSQLQKEQSIVPYDSSLTNGNFIDAKTIKEEELLDDSQKAERPQRQRRSLERKDFIYEIKRPSSANKLEDEPQQRTVEKRKESEEEEQMITIVRKKMKLNEQEGEDKIEKQPKLSQEKLQIVKAAKEYNKATKVNTPNQEASPKKILSVRKLKGDKLHISSKKSKENKINVSGLCILKKVVPLHKVESPGTNSPSEENKLSSSACNNDNKSINSKLNETENISNKEEIVEKITITPKAEKRDKIDSECNKNGAKCSEVVIKLIKSISKDTQHTSKVESLQKLNILQKEELLHEKKIDSNKADTPIEISINSNITKENDSCDTAS